MPTRPRCSPASRRSASGLEVGRCLGLMLKGFVQPLSTNSAGTTRRGRDALLTRRRTAPAHRCRHDREQRSSVRGERFLLTIMDTTHRSPVLSCAMSGVSASVRCTTVGAPAVPSAGAVTLLIQRTSAETDATVVPSTQPTSRQVAPVRPRRTEGPLPIGLILVIGVGIVHPDPVEAAYQDT